MSKGDTARTNYEVAKTESTERIQARDQVLLLYLGAVGTIVGVLLGTSVNLEILLVLPYLALGASILVAQHNSVIGALGSFAAQEIGPFLENNQEGAPQWDRSEALRLYATRMVSLRTLGHVLLLLPPPILALVVTRAYSLADFFPFGLMWWFGFTCTGLSGYFIIDSHLWRRRLHSKKGRFDSDQALKTEITDGKPAPHVKGTAQL